jgi:hypothetical protein
LRIPLKEGIGAEREGDLTTNLINKMQNKILKNDFEGFQLPEVREKI